MTGEQWAMVLNEFTGTASRTGWALNVSAGDCVTGGVPGAQFVYGEALTECSLPLARFTASHYCRVTVEDAAGERAWSNPIRL